MKKIIALALWLCICLAASAQKIKKIEYFFDNDPGAGHGNPIAVTAADTVRINTAISVNGLSNGIHALYVRAKTDIGWGLTENFLFYVNSPATEIKNVEYFIDTDPGTGKGKKLTLPAQTDTLRKTYEIQVPDGLATGVPHYLCIRVKDAKGKWGLYALDTFKINTFAGFAKLELQAKREGSQTNMLWNITNSDAVDYVVEKSINGIDFTPVAKVKAFAGNNTYTSQDLQPAAGINFYRIQQTDAAGKISYSNIEKILFNDGKDGQLSLYPNPVKDLLNIRFSGKGNIALFSIFDAGGRIVKTLNMSAKALMQVDVSSLSPGSYFIHLSNGATVATGKFVKQ